MNYKEIYRRPPITDREWVMPFGKHKGQTIEYILDVEPWYITWLQENTDLDFDHTIIEDANK